MPAVPKVKTRKQTRQRSTGAEVATLADFQPDPRNANKGTERGSGFIEKSLRQYGAGRSILADKHGNILAGNKTAEAFGSIGMDRVRVVETDGTELVVVKRMDLDIDSKAARELAIADNRAGQISLEWDVPQLESLAEDFGIDLKDVGFGDGELEALGGLEKTEVVEDEIPSDVPTRCKAGELWLLGEHRLLCGDSTKAEDVKRLMGDERAGLMNTDPPYGVAYTNDERPNPGVAKPRVANDKLEDAALQKFLEDCFGLAVSSALKPDAAWYMWHAHLTQGYFAAAAAAAAANVILHRQIIWVKPVLLLGRGQYHWKHEPCFMGWVEGNQPPDYGEGNGERTQTTIWEIASVTQAERKEFNHSTPKPVGLFAIPMVKHLKRGEIAYEPFAGSGPQVIAAEQLKRRCFAMELVPAFCDVILARWEKFTSKQAEKLDG